MICVYTPDCTDFSGNGLGPVSPLSCTVTETLNGEWELTLEHPLDEAGKWRRLVEGCILRAPVPAAMTPGITIITQATPEVRREVWKVRTNGSRLMLRSGTGTRYKIIGKYKNGTEVVLLEKTTPSWYKMLTPDGKQGYMSTDWLQYVRTEVTPGQGEAVNEVVEPRQLRDQPFRIYRVVPELDKITVYARHVFYDLMDNMIHKYEPSSSTTGAAVVQNISSQCLSEHDFTFYSDLDSTAEEVVFENVNPVDAILGDGGLVEKYGGELARDWFDVFIVKRVGSDTDVQIRQRKNLLGIMCAINDRKLSSAVGFRGICRKVLIFLLVGVAHIVDLHVVGSGSALRGAVVSLLCPGAGAWLPMPACPAARMRCSTPCPRRSATTANTSRVAPNGNMPACMWTKR